MMRASLSATLGSEVSALGKGDIPAAVRSAVRLFLMNALGTIVAGSGRPVVDKIVQAGSLYGGGGGRCTIPARDELLNTHWCAVATGAAGHVDDFDDTHPVTYIHAGPSLVATCLTLAQRRDFSGQRFLNALAVGYETQFRIALTVSPEQYLAGWHSTGVFGVLGCAAAASVLLGHGPEGTSQALGFAANLVLGHQEGLGTMNKSFHAGQAAANGIFAARAAASGLRCCVPGGDPVEQLLTSIAIGYSPRPTSACFGDRWVLIDNLVKPFPCGIVAHPAVEAALLASPSVRSDPSRTERIVVTCSPLAARLTGIPEPSSELDARLSIPHAVAAALLAGRAGLRQFSPESIADPEIARLRSRVTLLVDDDLSEFSANVRVERTGADAVERSVDKVIGSPSRPMTPRAIQEKFTELVEPVLPGRARPLLDAIGALGQGASPRDLIRLTAAAGQGTGT